MSLPEPAAQTEAQQILQGLDYLSNRIDVLITAVNGLGANQQWIVDNVKQIFEMFGSPAFMSQMMGVLNAGPNAGPAAATVTEPADWGTADDAEQHTGGN